MQLYSNALVEIWWMFNIKDEENVSESWSFWFIT